MDISAHTRFLQAHEEMIEIRPQPGVLLWNAYYHRRYPGAIRGMWTRKAVWLRLLEAQALLGSCYQLVLFDTFRTLETQKHLYQLYWQQIQSLHPSWEDSQITTMTDRYVFNPFRDPIRVPAHNSGGAVDLTLIEDGRFLDMGGELDEMSILAQTSFFDRPFDPELGMSDRRWAQVQKNRRLLLSVMEKVGFSNYEEEWWHFDYGSVFWKEKMGSGFAYASGEAAVNALTL